MLLSTCLLHAGLLSTLGGYTLQVTFETHTNGINELMDYASCILWNCNSPVIGHTLKSKPIKDVREKKERKGRQRNRNFCACFSQC